jgi:ABC-2 type transport system permease protein
LQRAKLTAALAPVAVIVSVPILFLTAQSLRAGLALAIGCTGAALSAGLISIWLGKPGKRIEFNRRQKGNWLSNVVQTAIDALWAGAVWIGVSLGLHWMLIPAALAVAVTAALRRPPSAYAY